METDADQGALEKSQLRNDKGGAQSIGQPRFQGALRLVPQPVPLYSHKISFRGMEGTANQGARSHVAETQFLPRILVFRKLIRMDKPHYPVVSE